MLSYIVTVECSRGRLGRLRNVPSALVFFFEFVLDSSGGSTGGLVVNR